MSDFGDEVRREEFSSQAKRNYRKAKQSIEAGEVEQGVTYLRRAADAKEKLAQCEDRPKVAQKHREIAKKWRAHADDFEQGRLQSSGSEGKFGSDSRPDNDTDRDGTRSDKPDNDTLDIEPEKPSIDFSDVGGMADLKRELIDKIATPIEESDIYSEVYGIGSIPGALLQGPPGTGKTHITKALAGELDDNWSFIEIDLSEITSSYIGQGAKNLASVFETARENEPCVLFFDEIDSVAGNRADSNSQTHSERQMLTTILTEMNHLDDDEVDVVVIGATNDPESVDDALLNPKRLKEVIEVPLPDADARKDILRVELRNVPVDVAAIDLENIVDRTEGFSASDMAAVADEARRTAAKEATEQNEKIPVSQRHIDAGIDDRLDSLDDADKGGYLS